MSNHTEGLHHFHTRKRVHKDHKPYPAITPARRFMDKAIYVIGIVGPLMTIPQLIKIWVGKSATDVSLASWSGYLIYAIFWLIYGIMHKEKPIIITYVAWVALELLIVIGVLIYG